MRLTIPLLLFWLLSQIPCRGATPMANTYDFTQGSPVWEHNESIANIKITPEGMAIRCVGGDPYCWSQPADYPTDRHVRATIRMKSTADSSAEFHYGPTFVAERSAAFSVKPDGEWHEYSVLLPALGKGARLRLDPASGAGDIVVAWIRLETLPAPPDSAKVFVLPAAPSSAPPSPAMDAKALTVLTSQPTSPAPLSILHGDARWGDLEVRVGARTMARANAADRIVYRADAGDGTGTGAKTNTGSPDDDVQILDLASMPIEVKPIAGGGLSVAATIRDSGGATWTFTRRIVPIAASGAIEIDTEIQVDRERSVFHLPWITLFPGLGTFGESKHQGLFPGVEYLEDEPSSSEKDVRGAKALRRLPARHRITVPFMAIEEGGSFVALAWDDAPEVAALFDSPDRVYRSNAHLLALVSPAVGEHRIENDLLSYNPLTLQPGKPLRLRAAILGGETPSVVGAMQAFVRWRALPPLPEWPGGYDSAARLLARGWVDSKAYHDGLWRHAVWGDAFPPQPGADIPVYILRLAGDLPDAADRSLIERLRKAARRGLERLPASTTHAETVSHVVLPIAPLLFGKQLAYVNDAVAKARAQVAEFDAKGVLHYRPREGKSDYAQTHSADHANGLAAPAVRSILVAASLSGDKALLRDGCRLLDALSMYDNTVPRGAQTWEMPLHTPDILASAHLVEAFVLGYELTGNTRYLERARYWAWTGVPFIYLAPPTPGRVGLYATTAVLGATNWEAPYWIGQPVQWCGLVYGSALHRLARHDPGGPWSTLAKGITLTGLQETFPESDAARQGLLPDFFHLIPQVSDGPAINPATVQSRLLEAFDRGTLYDFRVVKSLGWLVHAPCAIEAVDESDSGIRLSLAGFGDEPYSILLSRVEARPTAVERIAPSDTPSGPTAPAADSSGAPPLEWTYSRESKILIVKLRGATTIQIR